MTSDDVAEQDDPSTTDEAADDEDVQGHLNMTLQPDRDARAPRTSEERKPGPDERGL